MTKFQKTLSLSYRCLGEIGLFMPIDCFPESDTKLAARQIGGSGHVTPKSLNILIVIHPAGCHLILSVVTSFCARLRNLGTKAWSLSP